jgi:hypothetical protein
MLESRERPVMEFSAEEIAEMVQEQQWIEEAALAEIEACG